MRLMPRSFIGPKIFGQVKLTLDNVSERIDIFSKIEEKKYKKYECTKYENRKIQGTGGTPTHIKLKKKIPKI